MTLIETRIKQRLLYISRVPCQQLQSDGLTGAASSRITVSQLTSKLVRPITQALRLLRQDHLLF